METKENDTYQRKFIHNDVLPNLLNGNINKKEATQQIMEVFSHYIHSNIKPGDDVVLDCRNTATYISSDEHYSKINLKGDEETVLSYRIQKVGEDFFD